MTAIAVLTAVTATASGCGDSPAPLPTGHAFKLDSQRPTPDAGRRDMFAFRRFAIRRFADTEIWTARLRGPGRQQVQLRRIRASESSGPSPLLSPDRRYLISTRGAEGSERYFIDDLQTRTSRPLTGRKVTGWAPDGHHVTVTTTGPQGPGIYALNITSRELSPLLTGIRHPSPAHWAPDGTRLLAYDGELIELDLRTGRARRLALAHSVDAAGAAYSPSGRRIVYATDDDKNGDISENESDPYTARELHIADTDGRNDQRLTRSLDDDEDPIYLTEHTVVTRTSYAVLAVDTRTRRVRTIARVSYLPRSR
ncbi:Tol-Pal system protein TolB [Paraconexibacter sp. AEG42_29]|uniref:Tol-Pal system protein TolB n=2 Tax=Paraconexibacter sp. AEG42_29 TaxID=2997339 RepID=A0AAU7AX65_9ACTN